MAVAAPASAGHRPLSKCVVVVTPRSFGIEDPELRHELERQVGDVRYRPGPLSARALVEEVRDADGLLAGLDEVNDDVFGAAPRLRVISRYGAGVDQVDLRAAAERHIVVTNTPSANSNAVADLTIALIFAVARDLVGGWEKARSAHWAATAGLELQGRWLGLIGLGRVGYLVAQKAKALGAKPRAYDPYVKDEGPAKLVNLDELLHNSDFLSLHVPLSDATYHLVDRALLQRLKPGASLVNTARGELVDEDALVWALDRGPLRGAALDVLEEEPPRPQHRLLSRENVLITPQMAAHTQEATRAMGRVALDNLLAMLAGRDPRYRV